MFTAAYVEVNCFALAVLLVILVNLRSRKGRLLFEQRLFLGLMGSNAALLILDTVLWILNGKPGGALRWANLILTAVYYALNTLPCILWCMFANYQAYRNRTRIRRIMPRLIVPAVFVFFLSAASVYSGWLFYFDGQNQYHRGRYFFLMALPCILYLVWAQLFIIRKRRQIEWNYYVPIFIFPVPPLVGAIVQSLFYGVSLVWCCMAVSVLMVFLSMQNGQLFRDHLTGLYNRRQLDFCLQERIDGLDGRVKLAGIMIDVDNFKTINDFYGHETGDRALADVGKILSQSFRRDDLVCRYGGDEFVVILEVAKKSDLQEAVRRLKRNVDRFIQKERPPYELSFSIGCDLFDRSVCGTGKEFLRRIDSLMYQDKKKSKQKRRTVLNIP